MIIGKLIHHSPLGMCNISQQEVMERLMRLAAGLCWSLMLCIVGWYYRCDVSLL
jgi:hypothetical protein